MNSLQNPTAAPYSKQGECEVRVTARAQTEEQAYAMCEPVVQQIRDILESRDYVRKIIDEVCGG